MIHPDSNTPRIESAVLAPFELDNVLIDNEDRVAHRGRGAVRPPPIKRGLRVPGDRAV